MILDLLPEGSPFLLERVDEFSFEDPTHDPKGIAADLIETMNHHKAFGLAANQCGVGVRAFALAPLPNTEKPIVCFNPEIIQLSENIVNGGEGCLSFPGLELTIPRPILVVVRYHNEDGMLIETQFANMHARGFLHELDHLNGIVFTSYVSKLKLDMAKKRRKKYAK